MAPCCVGPLLDAVTTHGVTQVAFVVYTPDRDMTRDVCAEIDRAFADIAVMPVIRVHDGVWHLVDAQGETPGQPCLDAATVLPVADLPGGPRPVPFRSRRDLAASIGPDVEAQHRVAPFLARLAPDPTSGPSRPGGPASYGVGPHERAWALEVTDTGPDLGPDDLARLVVALGDRSVREAVWDAMTCERARLLSGWWVDVVRRTPDPWLAEAACTLALVAWLSGHGALAWCAVERCRDVAPGHTGAAVVASFLEGAADPAGWDDPAPAERVGSRGRHMP